MFFALFPRSEERVIQRSADRVSKLCELQDNNSINHST